MLLQLEERLRQLPWLQEALISQWQLILISVGLILGLLGLLRMLRARKRLSGLRWLLAGLLLVAGTLAWSIAATQLSAYAELLPERETTRISFVTTAEGQQIIRMQAPAGGGEGRQWAIDGQRWRISARVLQLGPRWQRKRYYSFQHLIVLPAPEEGDAEQHAYRLLARVEPDLWRWLHEYLDWLPGIGAERWFSPMLPVDTGADYRIALLADGIQVRDGASSGKRPLDSP